MALRRTMTQDRDVRLPRLSRMASSKRNINSKLIAVAAAFTIATIVVVMGTINAPADPVNADEAPNSAESYIVYETDKKRLRGFSKNQRPSKDKTAAAMHLGDGAKTSETLQYRLSPPERHREPNEDIMAQAADAAARAAVGVEIKTETAVVGEAESDAGAAVIDAEAVWDGAWDAPLKETFNEFNPAPAGAANEDILTQAAGAAARAAFKVEMAAEAAMAGGAVTDAKAVSEIVWDAPVEKTLNEFNAAPAEVAP